MIWEALEQYCHSFNSHYLPVIITLPEKNYCTNVKPAQ